MSEFGPHIRLPAKGQRSFKLADEQRSKLLSVLRCKEGDKIRAFAGDGSSDIIAELCGTRLSEARVVSAQASADAAPRSQLPLHLTLAFCPLAHADAQRDVITKATELGVDCLLPVVSDRVQQGLLAKKGAVNASSFKGSPSQSILPAEFYRKAQAHVIAASEQCERSTLPQLLPAQTLASFVDSITSSPEKPLLFVAHEGLTSKRDGIASLPRQTPTRGLYAMALGSLARTFRGLPSDTKDSSSKVVPVTLLTGPEGGFSSKDDAELAKLTQACNEANGQPSSRVHFVTLSRNILRAETAAAAFVSIIMQAAEDAAAAANNA